MKRTGIILVLIFFGLTFTVFAQDSDGDGLGDSRDDCPNQAGPVSNNGCPIVTTDPDDFDGDGTPNAEDECPQESGPDWFGGCPTDATSPLDLTAEAPLPDLPATDRCVLATQGNERVNVRDAPDLNANVVGQLDPQSIYPILFQLLQTDGDIWYLIPQGWVAAWVVRVGGNCDNVPFREEGNVIRFPNFGLLLGDGEGVVLGGALPGMYWQKCEDENIRIFVGAQDILGCDGSVIPFDGMEPQVECQTTSTTPCDDLVQFFEPMDEEEPILALTFLTFGSDVSFNPQPEPPPFCVQGLNLPADELNELGFDPQPDPPGDPYFCMALFGLGADEDGIIVVDSLVMEIGYPPDPIIPLIPVGDLLIGSEEEQLFICPGVLVGFNPQPEPPACVVIGF